MTHSRSALGSITVFALAAAMAIGATSAHGNERAAEPEDCWIYVHGFLPKPDAVTATPNEALAVLSRDLDEAAVKAAKKGASTGDEGPVSIKGLKGRSDLVKKAKPTKKLKQGSGEANGGFSRTLSATDDTGPKGVAFFQSLDTTGQLSAEYTVEEIEANKWVVTDESYRTDLAVCYS